MSKKYTFSEVVGQKELEACFSMRYRIYSESTNQVMLHENAGEQHFDINYFDAHARHYGVSIDNEIVGYFRVVLPRHEYMNEQVLAIGDSVLPSFREDYFRQNAAPFPFLSYEDVPDSHWEYYQDTVDRDEQFMEASRLILHPEHRSLAVSRFLIECALVVYVHIGEDNKHAIVDCFSNHSNFYRSYGFRHVNEEPYLLFGIPNITLSLPPFSEEDNYLPDRVQDRLMEMAREFNEVGRVERNW